MKKGYPIAAIGIMAMATILATTNAMAAKDIVHDAEFYVLESKYGEKWAAEDEEIDRKLAQLRKKHGTPPNIVHIMWDDTPVGEIGIPEIQKVRGFETPNMNKMAEEGMNFMRMYTEPSCTPSRAAVITGRHAIRNGMYNVGFPYEYGGLAADEVTTAEVLSEVGYATAFFGKSHLGDVESSYMNNQGFDEAIWTPYNQVPSLYVPRGQMAALTPAVMFPEMFGDDPYDMDKGWRPTGYVWALEGKKGEKAKEYGVPPYDDSKGYYPLDQDFEKKTIDFIHRNSKAQKPFYVAYWPQLTSFLGFPDRLTASGGLLQEALVRLDPFIGNLMQELRDLGIAENTLVIIMADNGPMTHNGPPGMTETLYKGGKGDFTEGAVRVPAIAWWPGIIAPGQIIGDIVHETDLFTTFARMGGATEHIPTDRIIDGIDQTSLLLNGDTYSRRDYNFIYTGDILAAMIKGRYKRHVIGGKPGLSGPEFYDLYNDTREKNGQMLPMFPAKSMFQIMKTRHQMWKAEYPDKGQNRDFPFKNLENPRPAVLEASKPRINPDKVPFDPRAAIMQVPEWQNLDKDWGAE